MMHRYGILEISNETELPLLIDSFKSFEDAQKDLDTTNKAGWCHFIIFNSYGVQDSQLLEPICLLDIQKIYLNKTRAGLPSAYLRSLRIDRDEISLDQVKFEYGEDENGEFQKVI